MQKIMATVHNTGLYGQTFIIIILWKKILLISALWMKVSWLLDFIDKQISRKQSSYKGYPALDCKYKGKDGIFI